MRREKPVEMVDYKGRCVPKKFFRAFVYSNEGQHLAESYEEYLVLIASKKWFSTKAEIPQPVKGKKHGSSSASTDNVSDG